MTLGNEIGKAIEGAVPGVSLGVLAVKVVAGLLVTALAVFLIWKVFFAGSAAQAKHDAVQAQGETAISNAGANAGKAAIPIINNNFYGQRASDAKSQENRNAILQAPGASMPVDPALAAIVRRDICLRASASGLPECRAMLGVRP